MRHSFDASSIIYAWDNYPEFQFPSLWAWLGGQMAQKNLLISVVAMHEVARKFPACAAWLKAVSITLQSETGASLMSAARIQASLGIVNGQFGTGVGENDLRIIAIAQCSDVVLISNEAKQFAKPTKLFNYKIPAVCALPDVSVDCISFLDLIKQSKAVF